MRKKYKMTVIWLHSFALFPLWTFILKLCIKDRKWKYKIKAGLIKQYFLNPLSCTIINTSHHFQLKYSTCLALHSYKIVGLKWSNYQNPYGRTRDHVFFIPRILPPFQNLTPRFPTVQLSLWVTLQEEIQGLCFINKLDFTWLHLIFTMVHWLVATKYST